MTPYAVKSVIVSVLISPCAFGLLSFSGTIQDGSKMLVDGAEVTVWDASTGKGLRVPSLMGHFALSGAAEGDYLFKVEKSGLVPAYGALRLTDKMPHTIDVVMLPSTGSSVGLIGAGAPLRSPFRPPRTSDRLPKVKPAQVTKKVAPVYPDADRKAGIQGAVRVAAIVMPDGTLDDLIVLTAPDASLALAALLAVRQWYYSPTSLDGRAVEASLTIEVKFER